MKITLWADFVSGPLEASISGDVITINGEVVDLSGVPDGHRLPGSAIGNKWFVEDRFVERNGEELSFTLRLPVQQDSPVEFRNPKQPLVISTKTGKVNFPDTSPPAAGVEPVPLGDKVND